MTEPTRWLDDPAVPSNVREVLGAASAAPPISAQTHARLAAIATGLVAQGVALPAAAASASTSSLATWLGIGSTSKAVILVSLMGALGSASYFVTKQVQEHAASVPMQTAAAPVRSSGARPAVNPTVGQEQPRDSDAPQSVLEATAPGAPARALPSRNPNAIGSLPKSGQTASPSNYGTASFDELSIADEARLLEEARANLANEPARALRIASSHQNLYPNGQMSAEREFIIVDALLRLGRRSEAEQRAAPRLRQSPESLYARRLRQLLAPKVDP